MQKSKIHFTGGPIATVVAVAKHKGPKLRVRMYPAKGMIKTREMANPKDYKGDTPLASLHFDNIKSLEDFINLLTHCHTQMVGQEGYRQGCAASQLEAAIENIPESTKQQVKDHIDKIDEESDGVGDLLVRLRKELDKELSELEDTIEGETDESSKVLADYIEKIKSRLRGQSQGQKPQSRAGDEEKQEEKMMRSLIDETLIKQGYEKVGNGVFRKKRPSKQATKPEATDKNEKGSEQ